MTLLLGLLKLPLLLDPLHEHLSFAHGNLQLLPGPSFLGLLGPDCLSRLPILPELQLQFLYLSLPMLVGPVLFEIPPLGLLLGPGVLAALVVDVDAHLAENVEAHYCQLDSHTGDYLEIHHLNLFFTTTFGICNFSSRISLLVDYWKLFIIPKVL